MGGTPTSPDALLADVLADLMKLYDAASQEDLARKLDKPTRTVQRWFAAAAGRDGKGPEWENAVELLHLSGRLQNGETARTVAEQERARRLVNQMADEFARLRGLV